jgi:arginyl-tRNA synthetase
MSATAARPRWATVLWNLLRDPGLPAVLREFYYNDAGAQITNLACRCRPAVSGVKPGDDAGFPADGYRGDYIADIARDFLAGATVGAERRRAGHRVGRPPTISTRSVSFAVAYLRHEQDLDLQAFGVRFDHYYLESSLYTDGRVATTRSTVWSRPAGPSRTGWRAVAALHRRTVTTRTA